LAEHPSVSAEVPIRDAVTVALLRDGSSGIETWLLTRVRNMVFAAGMTVFPGGGAEPGDAEIISDGSAFIAERFECGEDEARMLVGTAVRELEEETAVRITDAAALRPFARWVTPLEEPRRYDTRFFLAALPAGAEAQDVTSESSFAEWVDVAEALRQLHDAERNMLPPTRVVLEWLTHYPTADEALAAADERPILIEQPTIVFDGPRALTTLRDGTVIETRRPDRAQS
jgi:8-oxo-dGTP pyrophosphatase MutT (NUDIX family)